MRFFGKLIVATAFVAAIKAKRVIR